MLNLSYSVILWPRRQKSQLINLQRQRYPASSPTLKWIYGTISSRSIKIVYHLILEIHLLFPFISLPLYYRKTTGSRISTHFPNENIILNVGCGKNQAELFINGRKRLSEYIRFDKRLIWLRRRLIVSNSVCFYEVTRNVYTPDIPSVFKTVPKRNFVSLNIAFIILAGCIQRKVNSPLNSVARR